MSDKLATKADTQIDALDFMESRLLKAIDKGNVTAIIFYLKTKGKDRGYIEPQEIDHGMMNPQKRFTSNKTDY